MIASGLVFFAIFGLLGWRGAVLVASGLAAFGLAALVLGSAGAAPGLLAVLWITAALLAYGTGRWMRGRGPWAN